MQDINGAQVVQVEWRDNRLWINVDGLCVLRINGFDSINFDLAPERAVPVEIQP